MAEPFIGEIMMVGFNFPPRGWAQCNGQLLQIASNTALFSLLGTTFGGDGRVTFGLPDLRGRSAKHVGTGPGLAPVNWGQRGGSETTTLTTAQLPNHTHTLYAEGAIADNRNPDGRLHALSLLEGAFNFKDPTPFDEATGLGNNLAMAAEAIGSTGGNQSFSHLDPFLGIYHVIALTGIFPSRA